MHLKFELLSLTILPKAKNTSRFNNSGPHYDRNEGIRADVLRIIDENGENAGEMSKMDAVARARELSLDLVLISPNSKPPVAKIMSWSKFKYEQSRKKRESKGKKVEVKEMWFKPKIEEGDIQHKIKRVKEFITKGDRVKITVRAQGRVTQDQIRGTMHKVLEHLVEFAATDGEPKFEGRNYTIFVKPK